MWIGELAQLGERLAGSQKVRGSSPLFSTIIKKEQVFFRRPALFYLHTDKKDASRRLFS